MSQGRQEGRKGGPLLAPRVSGAHCELGLVLDQELRAKPLKLGPRSTGPYKWAGLSYVV